MHLQQSDKATRVSTSSPWIMIADAWKSIPPVCFMQELIKCIWEKQFCTVASPGHDPLWNERSNGFNLIGREGIHRYCTSFLIAAVVVYNVLCNCMIAAAGLQRNKRSNGFNFTGREWIQMNCSGCCCNLFLLDGAQ